MKELPSCLFLFILMDTIELGSGGISKARKILVGDISRNGNFFYFFPLEEKDALKNKSESRRLAQLLFFLLLNWE